VHGANAGPSTATAVWDGDGIQVISDLLDTTGGPLTGMVRPEAVRAALKKCVDGAKAGRNAALLRQFTYLAVATHTLQPDAVRKVRPTTYRALTGRPESVPTLARVAARPMRFVRRTRVGKRIWTAVRGRLLR
jgi:asparagine synthase (glutamine-hydrolysing)